MHDVVKAHGAAWIAKKAAELGYLIPSTISRQDVPVFNFWLERYLESPIERYVLAMSRSEDLNMGKSLPPEMKQQYDHEMEQRQWFEDHLEDFYHEMDSAVDYIANELMKRKNIRRCLKGLSQHSYDTLISWGESVRMEIADGTMEDDSSPIQIRHAVFRGEWEKMKALEETGYIVIQEEEQEEDLDSKLYEALFNLSEGKPHEFEDTGEDFGSFEGFLYMVHTTVFISPKFLMKVADLLTEQEERRLMEQNLVQDIMDIVRQFYVVLPLDDILWMAQSIQRKQEVPEEELLSQESLIQCINRMKDSKAVEMEGITCGVTYPQYRDYLLFRRKYGPITIQEYRTAVEADDDVYNTVYEYLAMERIDKYPVEKWSPELYMGYGVLGYLIFRGSWLRMYALLAVILLEERNMNIMSANFFNSVGNIGDDDPFHKEVESMEFRLQQAFDLVNKLGKAMYDETSVDALMEILNEEVDVHGLKRKTQEALVRLIHECYQGTPNSDCRGALLEDDSWLTDDYEFSGNSDDDSEHDDDNEYDDDEYDEYDEDDGNEYDDDEYVDEGAEDETFD